MVSLIATWVCYFAAFYLGCLGAGLLYRRGFLPLHLSALVGVGAYVFAVFSSGGLGLAAAILAVLITMLIAFLCGLTLVRIRGAAAALATISMQLLFDRYVSTASWTGRSAGTAVGFQIPSPTYKMVAAVVAIVSCSLLYVLFQRSAASRWLIVDGHTPLLTVSLNSPSPILAMTLANLVVGLCAGIAGFLLALQTGFVAPANFSLNWSLLYSGTILLVGWHRAKAIALGAFLLALLPELLRFAGLAQSDWSAWRGVAVGLIVALVVLRQFPRMRRPPKSLLARRVDTVPETT